MKPALCLHCKLEVLEHPVLHCLYSYVPVLDGIGKLVGYEQVASPIHADLHGETH